MQFFLANPLYWLLAAALIPLIVHLLARSRPKDRKFSSLYFLREVISRQVRIFRPKNRLLLLLRTLAMLALAAAFLLPYIGGHVSDLSHVRNVIIVLDTSASMGAADGQELRMAQAEQTVTKIVNELRATDKINLISAGARPSALFERPEQARQMVLRELSRLHSAGEESDAAAAVRLAVEQARSLPEGQSAEIYVVSDFQASNWAALDYASLVPDKIPVRWVSVAQSPKLANTYISAISTIPAKALPGQPVTVNVTLGQCGKAPVRTTLHLEGGSLRTSQVCEIPANGTTTASFSIDAPTSGSEWVLTASTDPDAFPADNERRTILPLNDRLSCQAVAADPLHLGTMLRALQSIPFLDCQIASGPGEHAPDFLIWNAPAAEDIAVMEEKAREGAVVLAIPDFSNDTAANAVMGYKPARAQLQVAENDDKWTLEIAAPQDRVFRLFPDNTLSPLLTSGVYRRLNDGLQREAPQHATVLLRYADGVPAIVRRPVGRGAVILWNIPVHPMDTRWGSSPLYLPLVAETLTASRMASDAADDIQPGAGYLSCAVPPNLGARDIILQNDGGELLPTREVKEARRGMILQSETPAEPGFYTWRRKDDPSKILATQAVNFPAAESVLETMDTSVLPQGIITHKEENDRLDSAERRDLWPWCIALALLFLAAELLICCRASGKPSDNQPTP